MSAVSRMLDRVWASSPYRSWDRYMTARGNVLAGGVAYLGFFSVIPALVLAFTVFGFVLSGHPELFDSMVQAVSQTLPGVVRDEAHPNGLIDATNPPTVNALTVTGLVSLVTLLLAGTGWVDALRESVRAVFAQPKFQINPVKGTLLNLLLLGTLGLAFVVSGALSLAVGSAGSWILDQLGADPGSLLGQVVLRGGAVLAVLAADTLLVVVVLRLMSGLDLPRSDVLRGSLLGAVGLGVLKQVSGLLLAGAARRPVLGSFAVIIGLLIVLNLMSRILLLSAAWAATRAHDGGRLMDGAAAARQPAPAQPREVVPARFGQPSADRTAVAAGAVLGVMVAVAARGARDGLRAAAAAVRGH